MPAAGWITARLRPWHSIHARQHRPQDGHPNQGDSSHDRHAKIPSVPSYSLACRLPYFKPGTARYACTARAACAQTQQYPRSSSLEAEFALSEHADALQSNAMCTKVGPSTSADTAGMFPAGVGRGRGGCSMRTSVCRCCFAACHDPGHAGGRTGKVQIQCRELPATLIQTPTLKSPII